MRKKNFKNKDGIRELWYNVKHSNIHNIGILEGEERDKVYVKK